MEIFSSIIFPFLLGLLGFIEPCSIGTNLIFFQYMLPLSRQARIIHSLLFMLSRSLFLSLIGLSSSLVGQQVIGVQDHYIQFLGVVYLIFGLIIFMKGDGWGFRLPQLRIPGRSLSVLMGGVFGLAIPACASPLIMALAGGAAVIGRLWFGFLTLFIFGLGLSLPLIIAIWSNATRETMVAIALKHPRLLKYLVGSLLLLAGLYTFLARSGSLEVILQK